MKTCLKTLPLLAASLLATAPQAETLTVEMSGFTSDSGQARIIVMAGHQGYHGTVPVYRTASVPITNGTALWQADDIAPGRYAVIAHHDQNANDDLDRPVLTLPLEPYGYSQGAWTSSGLPDWDEVAFTMADTPIHQHIHMRMNAFAVFGKMLAIGAPFLALILGVLALLRIRRLRTPRTV